MNANPFKSQNPTKPIIKSRPIHGKTSTSTTKLPTPNSSMSSSSYVHGISLNDMKSKNPKLTGGILKKQQSSLISPRIYHSSSTSQILGNHTIEKPGGKLVKNSSTSKARSQSKNRNITAQSAQDEYKALVAEFERLQMQLPIDTKLNKNTGQLVKGAEDIDAEELEREFKEISSKVKKKISSHSKSSPRTTKVKKSISSILPPSTSAKSSSKSPAKLAYMEDYTNIKSELLNLVEKETQRQTKKLKSGTKQSSKTGKNSKTFSSATAFMQSPLTMNFDNNEMNLFKESSETSNMVNQKLDELSKLFRESLKAATKNNPLDAIKNPKLNKLSNKSLSKLEKDVSPKLFSYGERIFNSDDDEEQKQQEQQQLELEIENNMVFGKQLKKTGAEQKKKPQSILKDESSSKSSKKKMMPMPIPAHASDGIVELRSLLESNAYMMQHGPNLEEEHTKSHKPTLLGLSPKPKVPTKKLAHNPYLQAQAMLEKYREKIVIPELSQDFFQTGTKSTKKVSEGEKPQGRLKKEATFIVNSSTTTRDRGETGAASSNSGRSKPTKSTKSISTSSPANNSQVQEKLGKSVKTIEDAAKVANALGSLMSRIVATRNTDDDYSPAAILPTKVKNLRNNNSTSFTSTAGSKRKGASFSTQTSNTCTQEIQTDISSSTGSALPSSNLSRSDLLQKQIESIKFTKDMSPEDQFQLQQLRSKKHEWENYKFQA